MFNRLIEGMCIMGKHAITLSMDQADISRFMYHLINDIKALEYMLAKGMFDSGARRIGAEQELCLVDRNWRPAPMALEVLADIDDDHFTTEHSRYNLEINLDPLPFRDNCLSEMAGRLKRYLEQLAGVAANHQGDIILVGILPTIRRSDLSLENLTPLPRYHLLSEAMNKLKGGPYEFHIMGADELITKHNSIMFEGCNTSFQMHLQVPPERFISEYNWAQAIAAPVLAAAVNSPLLLGKRLWEETRIALFQQSVDTRRATGDLREKASRITFGHQWLRKSITEIFQEDIARYRVLVAADIETDALAQLADGRVPELKALQIHNGTVYKWNRPCYGITDGKPHLRIENRILPAGPTVADEIANMAFWLGLMTGIPENYRNIAGLMAFDDAKTNFLLAARNGLQSQFKWIKGVSVSAQELILKELLPVAQEGLRQAQISAKDRQHYLGIVEQRVRAGKTGAAWMLDSFTRLRKKHARYEACAAISAGILERQKAGKPVHKWKPVRIEEAGSWINRFWNVGQIMYSDLYTVRPEDPVHFAANIMNWKHLRHLPVENDRGELVGLVTTRVLLEFYSAHPDALDRTMPIKKVMIKNPHTVTPEMLSIDALLLMRKHKIGCLPVVNDGKLLGVITELNFMNFSEETIQALIRDSEQVRGGK